MGYVRNQENGKVMHFDIVAPREQKDTSIIYGYGKAYLKTKGQAGQSLTAKECRFCHIETLRPQWKRRLPKKGILSLRWKIVNK